MRTGLAPVRAPGISSLQRGKLAMIGGRETHVMRFTGDGTESTQKQHSGGTGHAEQVERDFIPIAARSGAGGYSRV